MADAPPPPPPFHYATSGRNTRTVAVVCAVYLALGAAWLWADAAWWIVAIAALFTTPALWDLLSDRASGLSIDNAHLRWHSGRHAHGVPLGAIRTVRFDTRLDFSVRVTLLLRNGTRVRLPYDALPPHRTLERALAGAGVTVERHHFTLL